MKSEKYFKQKKILDTNFEPDESKSLNIDYKTDSKPLTTKQMIDIRKYYKNKSPHILNQIKFMSIKSHNNPQHKFTDLYKLICSPILLFNSTGTVMSKKGSTTKGFDPKDISDSITIEKIEKISSELKSQTFKFKPVKRVYVDKTGKNPELNKELSNLSKTGKLTKTLLKEKKARPLGILSFSDKIVAESIRVILNSIYEPEFNKLNLNYGFRPYQSPREAINHHVIKAKSHNYVIEADITGAFDNVNHDILLKILSKKIDDHRFLNLIKKSLNSGIFFSNNLENPKIGTTQGSALSPLLYNIYFHEFDTFIHTKFTRYIYLLNKIENRIEYPYNPKYTKITKQKKVYLLNKTLKELRESYITDYQTNPSRYYKILDKYKQLKQNYEKLNKLQKITPRLNLSRKIIRFTYTRYADDWIFSTNASEKYTKRFKELFSNWIEKNLNLELSPIKTKITNLTNKQSEKCHFLGFNLAYYSNKGKHIKAYNRIKTYNTSLILHKKQTYKIPGIESKIVQNKVISHTSLIVSVDHNRLLSRLEQAKFIRKKRDQYFGRRKPEWSVLEPMEIIDRYNEIIRGYLSYYAINLTYPTELNFIIYLLQYSCLHTLANKFNTTISKIIKRFGKSPSIKYKTETTTLTKTGQTKETSEPKESKLISWTAAKEMMSLFKQNYKSNRELITQKSIDEICTVKVNWRTKYKLTDKCPICGATGKLEYHHIRSLKDVDSNTFTAVMQALGRKQIIACPDCHKKIHKGEYDHIKLTDLWDERIILL